MLTPEDIKLIYEMKLAIAGVIAQVMQERGEKPTHVFEFLDCSYEVVELFPHCWVYDSYLEHKLIPYIQPDRRISNDRPDLN